MSTLTTLEATPEAALAGRGPRFAAAVLDGVANTLVLLVGVFLGEAVGGGAPGAALAVVGLLGWLFYAPLSMQLLGGATPGKAAFGLWVSCEDGRPAGFGIGLARDVVLKSVLGVLIVVDPLLVLLRADRRALHDLLIGTTVRSGRDGAQRR